MAGLHLENQVGLGGTASRRLSPAGTDRRVDAMLAKLILERKIKLVGGVDAMFAYALSERALSRDVR
jgi:hypothetical protein